MINKNIIHRKRQENMRLVKIAVLFILGLVVAQAKVIKKNNKIVKSDIMTYIANDKILFHFNTIKQLKLSRNEIFSFFVSLKCNST